MAARHAILMSPAPESNAGGVERFCWLLAGILQEQGWRTSIVGPSRQPGRWTFRFGASPLLWSISTGHAVAAANRHPDLIVGNGFLGVSAPRGVPRIQVFHGTSAAEILATRPSLPRRDFLRRLVGYWPLEAIMCRAGAPGGRLRERGGGDGALLPARPRESDTQWRRHRPLPAPGSPAGTAAARAGRRCAARTVRGAPGVPAREPTC